MAAHREANGRGTLEPTLRRGTDVPLPGAERHQLSFRRNERRHPAFRRSWRDDDWWWGNPGRVYHTESASRRDRGRRPAHVGSRWRQSGNLLHSRRGWARSRDDSRNRIGRPPRGELRDPTCIHGSHGSPGLGECARWRFGLRESRRGRCRVQRRGGIHWSGRDRHAVVERNQLHVPRGS